MDKPVSKAAASPLFKKLQYFSLFVPFRVYFVLFALATLAVIWLLNGQQGGVVSSFSAILTLLTKVFIWFCGILVALNFLTAFVPFVIFFIQKKNNRIFIKVSTTQKNITDLGKQAIELHIQPVIRPPFGFLKYRLVYDGQQLSPKFSVINNQQKIQFFTTEQKGVYEWPLPEIKAYQLEKMVVYFEDLFQFFSFSTALKIVDRFFTKPPKNELAELAISPKKTEQEETRIEELRRVEGEYLHYKNFENNDDVRRIVWKIYAKNKELVVRTPEVLDPFASHVYMYASYQDGLGVASKKIIAERALNYYKTANWSVFKNLQQKGFEIRYLPDQELKQTQATQGDEKTQQQITLCQWHTNGSIQNYVNTKIASVVCISSLSPVAEVQALADSLANDTCIVFVKLSNSYKKQGITHWLRWIFLQEEKEANNINLMNWNLSHHKRKMMQNEKAIMATLKNAAAKTLII